METFAVVAGSALPLRGSLVDDEGQAIGYGDPPPTLAAEVWPGGRRAESFAVAASWVDAAAGEFALAIRADQTATLAPGRYRGQLVVHDPDLGPGVAYEWMVDVRPAPGDEAEPPNYCGYEDLLAYGRSWLPDLQVDGDQAGYAAQRGRARSWLDDLVLAALPSAAGRGYGLPFGGWGYTTAYLREQLDAGRLIRRGWVVEATAKMALALICEGQVGPGESAQQFASLARLYRHQANTLAMDSTAELAGDDGAPAYRVHLATRSTR